MQGLTRVGRDTGVLTTQEVRYIRSQVIRAAWPTLRGRQIMPVKNLGSVGYMKYRYYNETDMGQATISLYGNEQNRDVTELAETTLDVPIIHKDFRLYGRDIEAARLGGRDLNTQNAENAARQCAEEEDKLIFSGEYTGWPALGLEGFATKTGRNTTAGGDWSANYLTYVQAAITALEDDGFEGGRKVLVIRSSWMAQLSALISNTAELARKPLYDLLGGPQNVIVTNSLYASDGGTDNALVIDMSPDNFELIVAEDYLVDGPDKVPGKKIYESEVSVCVVPAIYRATSVCEITSLT